MQHPTGEKKTSYYWLCIANFSFYGTLVLYWKVLENIPPFEVLAFRVVLSFVSGVVVLAFMKKLGAALEYIKTPRAFLFMLLSGLTLTFNWGVYIYGVVEGFVLQCALGLFITPLCTAFAGIVFFREKPDAYTVAALCIAACGVGYMTLGYTTIPYVTLLLVASYPTYLSIRKVAGADAYIGTVWESALICPFAAAYLIWLAAGDRLAAVSQTPVATLLLLLSGVVTFIPLCVIMLCQKHIDFVVIGLINYISPVIQLFLGLFLFNETLSRPLWVALFCIISALFVFTVGQFKKFRACPPKLSVDNEPSL